MRFPIKTTRKQIQIVLVLVLAGIACLPALLATAAPDIHGAPLLSGAQVSPGVYATLERACQNCHSENTSWPWYSKLPVVSARIHGDVAEARQFMNFSKWNEYTNQQKRGLLGAIAYAAHRHEMPPRGYRLMHPEARLSDAEFRTIESWAEAEQQRIREAGAMRAAH